MKKKIKKVLAVWLCVVMVATVFVVAVPMNVSAAGEYGAYFAGGDGTASNPYQIANVNQLQNMELNLNAHYILINDIDASATSGWNWNGTAYEGFEPIGPSGNGFTGTFNGKNFAISKLYINRPGNKYVGLFGYDANYATIKNVGLEDVDMTGINVGGLVACTHYTTISNCYSTGNVNGTGYIGGLVFSLFHSTVSNSYSTANVNSTGSLVGGLAGMFCDGQIINCYSTGNVNGDTQVGGLIGGNGCGHYAYIYNSYSTGNVNGTGYVGGLMGRSDSWIRISNSYSIGSVTGIDNVGGLVGYNDGIITSSYWDIQTSGQSGSPGGEGKTTAEMMSQSTFSGWDFATVWGIYESYTYPYLQWSPPVANAGGPYTADEGTTIIFNASASYNPDGDELQYRWDFDNDGIWDTDWSSNPYAEYTWGDDYEGEVVLEVSDGELTDTDTASVTVNNGAPNGAIESVEYPFPIILECDEGTFTGSGTDPGSDDLTFTWNWGDGTSDTITIYYNDGVSPDPYPSPWGTYPFSAVNTVTHVYTHYGLYTVTLTISDDDGGIVTLVTQVKVDRHSFETSINPPLEIEPGESAIYTITLSNTGTLDDTYNLELFIDLTCGDPIVDNSPWPWVVNLTQMSVFVPAFSSQNVILNITPPHMLPLMFNTSYNFTVKATCNHTGEEMSNAPLINSVDSSLTVIATKKSRIIYMMFETRNLIETLQGMDNIDPEFKEHLNNTLNGVLASLASALYLTDPNATNEINENFNFVIVVGPTDTPEKCLETARMGLYTFISDIEKFRDKKIGSYEADILTEKARIIIGHLDITLGNEGVIQPVSDDNTSDLLTSLISVGTFFVNNPVILFVIVIIGILSTAYPHYRDIKIDGDFEMYRKLGKLSFKYGSYKTAIENFKKAVWLNPNDAVTWNDMGIVLRNKGKYKSTLKCYDKAIKINPNYERAWYNKGCALSQIGDYYRAFDCFNKVVELNAENLDAANMKEEALSRMLENN